MPGAVCIVPSDGRLDTVIALAATALALFVIANVYPLVALTVNGSTRMTTPDRGCARRCMTRDTPPWQCW